MNEVATKRWMVETATSPSDAVVEFVRDEVKVRRNQESHFVYWKKDIVSFYCQLSVYCVTGLSMSRKLTMTCTFAFCF